MRHWLQRQRTRIAQELETIDAKIATITSDIETTKSRFSPTP